MTLQHNIAESFRLHLSTIKVGDNLTDAHTVVITPEGNCRLSNGQTWYFTDRQWARLSSLEGHVMGHTAVNYIDGSELRFASSFGVNIYKPYANKLKEQVAGLSRSPRYSRYDLGAFVAWLPMRISHTSDAFIVLDRDISMYASKLDLRPISYHERGVVTPTMSSVGNTIDVFHYFRGKKVETSKILIKGRFNLFGFDFNSVEEAYVGLTELLQTSSIKSGSRLVLPQLKDYNERCVTNELLQVLTEVGKIRGETIRLKSSPIVSTHYVIPAISDIPECLPQLNIPPC